MKKQPFKATKNRRLSTLIARMEGSVDRTIQRFGRWMDEKEAALYDRKVTRDALKLRKQLQHAERVYVRAAKLRDA